MKAVFVLEYGKWIQVTEAVRESEAKEYLEYYQKWFPNDQFELRQR